MPISWNRISIHAPRAGSDREPNLFETLYSAISIHAPRAGSDVTLIIFSRSVCGFQSTLPVRGATQVHQVVVAAQIFQSTLPVRGATTALSTQSLTATISIHAPRAGSDYSTYCNIMLISYFNPRSPCGERRANIGNIGNHRVFQSTLPVRGATEHNMKR